MENAKDPELNDAANLRKISRQPFLDAPAGYFEKLGDQVHLKTIATENQSAKSWQLKPIPLILALFLIAMLGAALLSRYNDQGVPKPLLGYEDILNSGYVYDYDENILIDECMTVCHDKSDSLTATEDYLLNNTDDAFLKGAL